MISFVLRVFFLNEDGQMRALAVSLWISLRSIPAFADPGGVPNGGVGQDNGSGNLVHAAPAPLLGFGIPSALAIGGVLLGAKLLGRRRQ